MKKRVLGKTGLEVSEVGFGAWAIGGTGYGSTDDKESLEALEKAFDCGVTFFDTADTYGDGRSEKLIARFLSQNSHDEVVVATKVGWDFYAGGHQKNFSEDYVRFACEESLKRLNLDALDLYQLHNPKLDLLRTGEPVTVLENLKKEGKIRHVGVSVHTVEDAMAALQDDRIEVLQLIFNMLDQRMASDVLQAAKEKQVGILAREPLCCGVLTDKHSIDRVYEKNDHRNRWSDEKRRLDYEKVQRLRTLFKSPETLISQAALAYVLSFDEIGCVIPGAKSAAQAELNAGASLNPILTPDEVMAIRELYDADPIFQKVLIPRNR